MTLGPRPALAHALPAIAAALLTLAQTASAQEAPKGELERAQKAADAVFHWIKLNADKGANRDKPAAAPAPAPAPVARKPAPAPAPVAAAAPRPAPTQTSNAAPATATTAAVAAPNPVAAAPQSSPEPEPDRTPVLLASAAPTPVPAAPMATAAKAVEPPPKPAEEEVDEQLKLLAKVDPVLPRQLQQGSFRNGFAQVQFTVGPDGSVQQASVIKASHARLGTAAVEAVKQWRFAPIRKSREAAVEVAFSNEGD
ncbi:MAG TPA: TonB family protein [Roseateles sp.]